VSDTYLKNMALTQLNVIKWGIRYIIWIYHIYLGNMMINMTLGVTLQTLKILYVCHCVTFTWSLQQRDGRSDGHRPKDMPSWPTGEALHWQDDPVRVHPAVALWGRLSKHVDATSLWRGSERTFWSFTFVHVGMGLVRASSSSICDSSQGSIFHQGLIMWGSLIETAKNNGKISSVL
jgi:hypothetical protein